MGTVQRDEVLRDLSEGQKIFRERGYHGIPRADELLQLADQARDERSSDDAE